MIVDEVHTEPSPTHFARIPAEKMHTGAYFMADWHLWYNIHTVPVVSLYYPLYEVTSIPPSLPPFSREYLSLERYGGATLSLPSVLYTEYK